MTSVRLLTWVKFFTTVPLNPGLNRQSRKLPLECNTLCTRWRCLLCITMVAKIALERGLPCVRKMSSFEFALIRGRIRENSGQRMFQVRILANPAANCCEAWLTRYIEPAQRPIW